MKLNYTYLYPLLLLLAAIACRDAQKQHEVRSPVAALCHIDVDSVYAVVGDNFESHPPAALQALQSLAAQKDCPQMTRQILAQTYFNMGAIQDERLEVLDSAIYYLDNSYELYRSIPDLLNAHNVGKYLGLLKVKSGQREDGLKQIKDALRYYKMESNEKAYHVSLRNYAKALDEIGDTEKSIVIMKEVIAFWQEQHDEVRLSIYEKDLADMTSK